MEGRAPSRPSLRRIVVARFSGFQAGAGGARLRFAQPINKRAEYFAFRCETLPFHLNLTAGGHYEHLEFHSRPTDRGDRVD
jgi:hypothetical protein